MHSGRRRKLGVILFMLVLGASAIAIILYQLRANINYFYIPADIVAGKVSLDSQVRVGGYVVEGSLIYDAAGAVKFVLTDRLAEVRVIYTGVLPGLFAEGDETVVLGRLREADLIEASQVLAKHDENYRPPELKELQQRQPAY